MGCCGSNAEVEKPSENLTLKKPIAKMEEREPEETTPQVAVQTVVEETAPEEVVIAEIAPPENVEEEYDWRKVTIPEEIDITLVHPHTLRQFKYCGAEDHVHEHEEHHHKWLCNGGNEFGFVGGCKGD